MSVTRTATARITTGSVFGVVSTAAGALSSTFQAATDSVGMLNRHIQHAAEKQSMRITLDKDTYKQDLIERKAQEEAVRKLAILEFVGQSEQHKGLYNEAYERMQQLLA